MMVATGTSTGLRIGTLDERTAARWDAFVESCPQATFFHRAGWKTVIEKSFGHTVHGLFAERDGALCAVVLLGHIRSRLFGNALISNPFCVYGGIVALDDAAAAALDEAACALARRLGVDYLEYRNRSRQYPARPSKDLYVTFRKELAPTAEENLQRIPRKQRAMVRKGMQAGLVSVIDADVERCHRLYADSVRNLGTPVFGKSYFRNLAQQFGSACEVLTVTHQGRAVSSVLSFYFRDEVLPYYGGGGNAARDLKANDFMYWELMRRSCERGVRVFDYGRSKQGSGSYSFKKNWGFEPEPLYYEYQLVNARSVPNVSPTNPKYRLFIDLWKHLPVPVTRLVGPYIARNLA